ncbi:glycosyltransferase [Paenibacillus sp. 7124]|uniref:Glycosyltransferase n=1 Tax=Paenibacillus apii TaxID=1850370 RepID=A0A6M1PV39_9BACL|nr:glycosyltransferase [Paenibacillus apii]NGM85593.1 glycosyltransferase [Paenibacillus apii]
MKKRLLFVMNNLHCGGAEKSLISLLQTLDYTRYEVDLFLFRHEGLFMSQIPGFVNLLKAPPDNLYFNMSIKTAFADCLRKGKLKVALARLFAQFIFVTEKNAARSEQRAWKYVSASIPRINGKYDAAIGFLEKNPIYCVIDKVDAKVKIGWIHTNYASLRMDAAIDRPFFDRLDYIVTVSDECASALHKAFKAQTGKIKVIHNIVSPSIIRRMSELEMPKPTASGKGCMNITTVARLSPVKGIDLAIEACRILVEQGYPVRWNVLGYGTDSEIRDCNRLIREYGLEEYFKLLGTVDNPYPYLKSADIYVQPSRFEGKSIAVDEAKIMGKPIIVTNFSTAKEQIEHRLNGWIAGMNPEELAEGIRKVIEDEPLRARWAERLAREKLGTEAEVNKLYELIS